MMNINWKVRIRNKNFWLALIPALLLLVQVVAAPFGYKWDFGVLNQQLAAIINKELPRGLVCKVVTWQRWHLAS